jgi:hypothetical protein
MIITGEGLTFANASLKLLENNEFKFSSGIALTNINVKDPTASSHAATKNYVDGKIKISTQAPTAADGNVGDIWIQYLEV